MVAKPFGDTSGWSLGVAYERDGGTDWSPAESCVVKLQSLGKGNLRMHRIRYVFVAPLLLLALSACSTHPSATPTAYGKVSGTLVMEGGALILEPGVASHTATKLIPGIIELSIHAARIVTIHVPVNGTFRAQVPVGTYEMAATTPRIQGENTSGKYVTMGSCVPSYPPITVGAGQTMSIQVTCAVP